MPQPLLSAEEIWRRWDAMEARLTAPLSQRMLDLARIGPGMRVLDLATGRGEPAIAAAHRVGPAGVVVGVDVAERMLAMARERAMAEGVEGRLQLKVLDAARVGALDGPPFDAVLARWGLMYMDAPVDALRGCSAKMTPEARLVIAVWAEPDRVPYYSLPRRVLERYRSVPPVDFNAPGVFRYATPMALSGDLDRAGLVTEHSEELDLPVMEVATEDELIAWMRAFGLTKLLNDLPEAAQRAWERDLVTAAQPFRADGVYRVGGATRLVVARKRN